MSDTHFESFDEYQSHGYGEHLLSSVEQECVAEFMLTADKAGVKNQRVAKMPTIPTEEERILTAKLMFEEVLESIRKGLGIELVDSNGDYLHRIDYDFVPLRKPDLVEFADGVADLEYVAKGGLLRCGIHNDAEIFAAVHKNNMKKFAVDENGKPKYSVSPDGKLIKPRDHVKVDLRPIVMGDGK